MSKYDHLSVEGKWEKMWWNTSLYAAIDFSPKNKRYILIEFPYPSGSGLHAGHTFRYVLPDLFARKSRMEGYNVLFPMGWDAFGLPAENHAVKTGVHPSVTTNQAIATFKSQFRLMAFSFDWSREINSTDPGYYKWTQWLFLKFFEEGLAELQEKPVWWCEELKIVLAEEEVLDDGKGGKVSERGEHPVVRRLLKQWVLKLPAYADKLLDGLEEVDFPEAIKAAQREWIGKSVGATLRFPVVDSTEQLAVFTTRPDTILGATFAVIAPEHPLLDQLKDGISNWQEVSDYRARSGNRSDVDRLAGKEKTGVKIWGIELEHPLLPQSRLPVFVADYVLMDYGTGAIMAVPAHDERDFEFAERFNIPIVQTVYSTGDNEKPDELPLTTSSGIIKLSPEAMNSLGIKTASLSCEEMKRAVIDSLSKRGLAEGKETFRVRDWLFSRQRYWGEPIPLVHCEDGTIEGITRTDDPEGVNRALPLLLPDVPDYLPSSDGASPLAKNKEWVTTVDSKNRPALRETNTMPNWAGSSWYYLRYIDPQNSEEFASKEKLKYWLPVDRYFGGSEHTTLHLLYSRFWHRFLFDQGLVPTPEPYQWRVNGGILLGEDGQKMSKSVGNVVSLDDGVKEAGADAMRIYVCFLGPYDTTTRWVESGLKACKRLVERIYGLQIKVGPGDAPEEFQRTYHKCVRKVSTMIDNLKANTAVSEIMIFVNAAEKAAIIPETMWNGFVRLIAPFAPFVAEELWQQLNGYTQWTVENSVHSQSWPEFDKELAFDNVVRIGVQVNGKVRDELEVSIDETKDSVETRARELEGVEKWLAGKEIKKFVYVPGRIINFVVG